MHWHFFCLCFISFLCFSFLLLYYRRRNDIHRRNETKKKYMEKSTFLRYFVHFKLKQSIQIVRCYNTVLRNCVFEMCSQCYLSILESCSLSLLISFHCMCVYVVGCYLSIQDHYHLCHFDNAIKQRTGTTIEQEKNHPESNMRKEIETKISCPASMRFANNTESKTGDEASRRKKWDTSTYG